jgi:hypothetical protein
MEAAVDVGILYMLLHSSNPFEIAALVAALVLHAIRQVRHRVTILETSARASPGFLLIQPMVFAGALYQMRTQSWPVPLGWAIALGVGYYALTVAFVKDSRRSFRLFDPKIDVPQLCISAGMTWLAVGSRDPVAILWAADLTYHACETVWHPGGFQRVG